MSPTAHVRKLLLLDGKKKKKEKSPNKFCGSTHSLPRLENYGKEQLGDTQHNPTGATVLK